MEHIWKPFTLFVLFLTAEVLAIVATGGWDEFVVAVNGWNGVGALLGALAIILIVLGLWLYHGAMDYSGKTGLLRIWAPIREVYTTTLWLPAIASVGALLVYFGRLSRPDTTTA